MRDVTLCILVKKENAVITEVCLAMKKRGFGAGKWNGVGGKIDEEKGETIEQALVRETEEEIGVKITDYTKVAIIEFTFPKRETRDWDQRMHTYFSTEWEGDPQESEEMKPQWFKPSEIPFDDCWPDDKYWVPEVIAGKLLKATFQLTEDQKMLGKNIKVVTALE